jgi:hypothetical protein
MGLESLTCGATSAYKLYEWLLAREDDLPLPLLTCRLLLAPTQDELVSVAGLADVASDACLLSVQLAAKAWRADAARRSDGHTLFYFAGHGFERKRRSHVLVLENVGDPAGGRLTNAIEGLNLLHGMAPSPDYPDVALQQLYFYDACRMPLLDGYKWEDESCSELWPVPTVAADPRVAVEYFTTEAGRSAFAVRNEQTIFNKALLACLNGGGAERVGQSDDWCVTVDSLTRGLRHHLAIVAREEGTDRQNFDVRGGGKRLVLVNLDEPPEIDLDLSIVPDEAAHDTRLVVSNLSRPLRRFGPPIAPNPLRTTLRAGNYVVRSQIGHKRRERLMPLNPPYEMLELEVL